MELTVHLTSRLCPGRSCGKHGCNGKEGSTAPQKDGVDFLGVGGPGIAELKMDCLCQLVKHRVLTLDGFTKQLPRKGQWSLGGCSAGGCQPSVDTEAGN